MSALLHMSFAWKFLIVACCTFRKLENNRIKLMAHWNYLATIATINKGLLKTILLSIIVVLG